MNWQRIILTVATWSPFIIGIAAIFGMRSA
jgi:hypothetical protein